MATGAPPTDRKWLEETKATLISLKVEECSNFSELAEILGQLVAQLKLLHQINEDTIVIIDTLSIWFTRATQYMKKRGDLKPDLATSYDLFNYIFTYVDQLHLSSLGAFTNAISGLLKKLLSFIDLTECPEELISGWIDLVYEHPPTHKSFYMIMEVLLKSTLKSTELILRRQNGFSNTCVEALKHDSLANSASKCLSLYIKRLHNPQDSTKLYVEECTALIRKNLVDDAIRNNLVSHLIPMVFREIPDEYVPWLRSLQELDGKIKQSPRIMLPLFQAGMQLSKANDPLKCGLVLESEVEQYLLDTDDRLRLDAFAFLCASVKTKSPPPPIFYQFSMRKETLRCVIRELLSPDDRTEFVTHLRSALLRIKGFAEQNCKKGDDHSNARLKDAQKLCLLIYDTMHSLLIPDLSYAQLSTATEMLSFIVTDEFDGISRASKKSAGVEVIDIFTHKFTRSLLRGTTNNYDDIRRRCSIMLSFCPYTLLTEVLESQPLEQSFDLLSLAKHGSAERSAILFMSIALAHVKNNIEKYFALLEETIDYLKGSVAQRQPISGLLAAIRSMLSVLTESVIRTYHEQLETSVNSIFRILEQQWQRISTHITGDETSQPTDNSGSWKVLKESALLYEALFDVNNISGFVLVPESKFIQICHCLMDQLATVSHRGAFTAILLAFMKCCSICYSGNLTNEPSKWLQESLTLVRTKKRLISRRSAGLPYLISGILVATIPYKKRIDEYTNLSFETLLQIANEEIDNSEQRKIDLPQVNAFNCMTQIFKESSLKKHYHKYMAIALNTALKNLNHNIWAIKNSALMLFTALQSSFFGSNKLEDVLPSVNVELFFSKYPESRDVLLSHLENLDSASINEAIPILSILSRLRATSSSEETIAPFRRLVQDKYLSHNLWSIREIAATLIANMTRTEEFAKEIENMIPCVTDSGNFSHGRLQCILELSRQVESSSVSLQTVIRFSELFDAYKNTNNAFKWVFMRLCVMIVQELSDDFKGLGSLKEALLESQAISGLDGSAKLFISTVVPVLMERHRDVGFCSGEDVAGACKNILSSWKEEEVLLAAVQHMLTDPDKYLSHEDVYNELIRNMKERNLSRHVFKRCLQLATKARFSTDKFANDESWPQEWKCYNMKLRAASASLDTAKFTERFFKFSEDEREILRMQALLAAEVFLKNQKTSVDVSEVARIQFQIHAMEADESPEIRRQARTGNPYFLRDLQWFTEYLTQGSAKDVMTEYLINSLTVSISDAEEELQNIKFDLERDNLYRNEVDEFSIIARTLYRDEPQIPKEIKERLICCLERASRLILRNEILIFSWTYSTHLDTVIRKVDGIVQATQDEDIKKNCKPTFEFLERAFYPLFRTM